MGTAEFTTLCTLLRFCRYCSKMLSSSLMPSSIDSYLGCECKFSTNTAASCFTIFSLRYCCTLGCFQSQLISILLSIVPPTFFAVASLGPPQSLFFKIFVCISHIRWLWPPNFQFSAKFSTIPQESQDSRWTPKPRWGFIQRLRSILQL